MLVFARRNFKQMLRDRLNAVFGVGFLLIVLLLLTVTDKNISALPGAPSKLGLEVTVNIPLTIAVTLPAAVLYIAIGLLAVRSAAAILAVSVLFVTRKMNSDYDIK